MSQIQSLQEKTYNYLSTVNAVVKNGKDIIYASTLARDIAKYQSEAAKYAVGDPKLLTIIAKTEYELISRSVDLMIYINNIALQGGGSEVRDELDLPLAVTGSGGYGQCAQAFGSVLKT